MKKLLKADANRNKTVVESGFKRKQTTTKKKVYRSSGPLSLSAMLDLVTSR